MRNGKEPDGKESRGGPDKGKQLKILQKQIREIEANLKKGEGGASIEMLEYYCQRYNNTLVRFYGEKGAQQLANYKVVNGKATTFIPRIQAQKIEAQRKKKKPGLPDNELDAYFIERKAGFDDPWTLKNFMQEGRYIPREAEVTVKVSKALPPGVFKLRIINPHTKKSIACWFSLSNEGLDIVLQTIDQHYRAGSILELIYNKSDHYERGLVRPPLGSNPALN